jgi:hypothetical protein
VLTARLAAEAIIAGGALAPDAVADAYRSTVRTTCWPITRCRAAQQRCSATSSGARGAIRVLATSDWSRRNFARWMFEDEPRAIASPPPAGTATSFHQPAPYQP